MRKPDYLPKESELRFVNSSGRPRSERNPERIQLAIDRILEARKGRTLGDMTIEDLLSDVRGRYDAQGYPID